MKLKLTKFYIIILLIVFIFLIINLSNLHKYGISWDEPSQQTIGRVYVNYLTSKTNSIKLYKYQVYYGPFYQILNELTSRLSNKLFNLEYIESHHFLGIILSSISIIFIFLFASKMFNKKIGLYSTLFFVFFPRFIAHTHYNTKDIPVMIFSLITLFFLYLTFKKRNYLYSIFAGIFFGISISTKINALLILPIFFFSYLLYLVFKLKILRNKKYIQYLKKDCFMLLIFLCFGSFFTFLIWPSLWKNPILFFSSIFFFLNHIWGGNVLYFGKLYSGINLPWHYAPVYLVIVTPLITLFFLSIGLYLSFKNLIKKKKILEHALLLSWLFIPLLMEMKPGIVRYDGIRHFFILVPALAILTGLGFQHTIKKIKFFFPKYKKYISIILIILISTILFSEVAKIHPYEGSYFNEAVRFFIPEHIENYFEIEYWGSIYRESINWLNNNAELNSTICIPFANFGRYYPTRNDLTFKCNKNSNYVMFITRKPFYTKIDKEVFNHQQVFKISRYNSDLLYIYKIK